MLGAFGALSAGATLVPVSTRFTGPEALDVIRRSGASVLIVADRFLGIDRLAALRAAAEAQAAESARARATTESPSLKNEAWRVAPFPPGSCASWSACPCRIPRNGGPPPARRVISWAELLDGAGTVPAGAAEQSAAAVRPDDVSDILFTSGTTGRSKGAMTAHRQSLAVARAWAERGRLTSNDRYLVVNPFFHSFGFKAGILACLVSGTTLVPQLVYDGGPCHVAGRVRADHRANPGRCGVVLAAGGFERNAANRQRYQRPPVGAEWTNRLARARRSARQ